MAQQEVTATDYMLKQLDMCLGSITEDSDTVTLSYPRQYKNASALSQLNVGQLAFSELHTLNDDDDHFPIFHPNLVVLFSRVLEEGTTNFLTTEQERLWNRYISYAWEIPSEDSGDSEDSEDSGDSGDSGDGCTCEPYVLPLMTTAVRGGAKLRKGDSLGNVELTSGGGMYVDVTSLDDQITELETKAAELNGETTDSSTDTSTTSEETA